MPLMEDVEFFRQLPALAVSCIAKSELRRAHGGMKQLGPLRLTAAYGLIATLYLFAVSPSGLSRIYQRACCVQDKQANGE
jgi:hypothetical protein